MHFIISKEKTRQYGFSGAKVACRSSQVIADTKDMYQMFQGLSLVDIKYVLHICRIKLFSFVYFLQTLTSV